MDNKNIMEIRKNYIHKVQNKIQKLSKSLSLLTQLDKSIINNINKSQQTGGSMESTNSKFVLTDLGTEIARTKARIDKYKKETNLVWQTQINDFNTETTNLNMYIGLLETGINTYIETLKALTFDKVDYKMRATIDSATLTQMEIELKKTFTFLTAGDIEELQKLILEILNSEDGETILNNYNFNNLKYTLDLTNNDKNTFNGKIKEYILKYISGNTAVRSRDTGEVPPLSQTLYLDYQHVAPAPFDPITRTRGVVPAWGETGG